MTEASSIDLSAKTGFFFICFNYYTDQALNVKTISTERIPLKIQKAYDTLKSIMDRMLWEFTGSNGDFSSTIAHKVKTLYFPLCNTLPLMSSITPDLHGDLKSGFNSFLLEPVSRLTLSNSRSSRNFWIYLNPDTIWSATGVSKDSRGLRLADEFRLEAGLLWHRAIRSNKKIGLRARITSFIPASEDPVEVMHVEISNISGARVSFNATAGIPMYARSANNLFDHRHVTSLLQRIQKHSCGIIVTPTLTFDERGHRKNHTSYFVLGIDEKYGPPLYLYPTQEMFTGDAGDLESPEAVLKNLPPPKNAAIQGKEAMAGLRFKKASLGPGEKTSYTLLLGISDNVREIKRVLEKFDSPQKIDSAFEKTRSWWKAKSSSIRISSGERTFDAWLCWVNAQPTLRKIFGCSFLPDFDYGKGGRGWRDLWQDCLSLLLNDPREARELLVNNFQGVRIDGSNATIIGKGPGEFIADRNNISRVWMDHGVWPWFTLHLYLNQTADFSILSSEIPYFRDRLLSRSKEIDSRWSPAYGKNLKTKNNDIYRGTILEHVLLQHLVQFFNVGEHNHILLEGADWNDGLDMAAQKGESVAFSAFYAYNLSTIADVLETLPEKHFPLLKEITLLLDTLAGGGIDYASTAQKRNLLQKYMDSVKQAVSGKKVAVNKTLLIRDLRKKSSWMYRNIAGKEWLKEGFFNGYYDNNGRKVEGRRDGRMRMTLTGQVFAVLAGIATPKQVRQIIANANKYLKDKRGGIRLNTDFGKEQPALGRAFSFVYGEKENGAVFNHMCVMYAYALYKQGFASEAYRTLYTLFQKAVDTPRSKIYPCLPEYFNAEGRGMYSYLTGSASWFMFTLLTQGFGIRGQAGDLLIEPKLVKEQFRHSSQISAQTSFAGKRIEVRFNNPRKKDYGSYLIREARVNGICLPAELPAKSILISRPELNQLISPALNTVELLLD